MLFKIRSLSAGLPIPPPVKIDGLDVLELDPQDPGGAMLGQLVRVPAKYGDRCERICGELNLTSFLPIGLDVKVDPPHDELNGLWVQRPVFEAVRKENGASSIDELEQAAYSAAFSEEPGVKAQTYTDPDTGVVVPEATEEDLQVLAEDVKKGEGRELMAENDPNPNPQPAPRPVAVSCPSCGSSYNTETHELITDSGLPKRIRELEDERDVWEKKAKELQAKIDGAPPAPPPDDPPPAPKKRKQDFFVA